jgi:four helix bundle protein
MATIEQLEELEVWQLSRSLVRETYELCRKPPLSSDRYLASQAQRAAVSCMANIAEGYGRPTDLDFARFLGISIASVLEYISHVQVMFDVGYIPADRQRELTSLANRIIRACRSLAAYLRRSARTKRHS